MILCEVIMDGLKDVKRLSTIRDDEGDENTSSEEPLNGEGPLFQQYLEDEGIIDFLTNELLRLYKENRPTNGLNVLKNNVSDKAVKQMKLDTTKEAKLEQKALEMENEALKYRVECLENANKTLSMQVEKLTIN